MTYLYRIARTEEDEEQILKLNYETFVEEIPQHEVNKERQLMDPFHLENTYLLCMKGSEVIGMMAVRSARPFSLDKKIGPVESKLSILPRNPVEVRLLTIDKSYRTGRPFLGMVQALVNFCLKAGYDAAFISGTVRELKLYRQLGFIPFAEITGSEKAQFVPMMLTLETFENGVAARIAKPMVNFLPGPVRVTEEVRKALSQEAVSHRSQAYQRILSSVQEGLKLLTNARHVQILQGTGTLANDVVAAQLSRIEGRGLLLVNGEFGERLCDHATRMNLQFDCLREEWGDSFDIDEVIEKLDANVYRWVWFVHCETSTGILNPLETIQIICQKREIQIAVDCISSLGSVSTNLAGIDFASSSSGKGLGSFAGLSLVFHEQDIQPDLTLPRYLDLGNYTASGGVPYTQSSGLVRALDQAVSHINKRQAFHFKEIENRAVIIRKALERIGYTFIGEEASTSPGILTISLRGGESASHLGENLFLNGYKTHYESSYLEDRNWLQLATMNEMSEAEVTCFLDVFKRLTRFNDGRAREINT